MNDGCWHSKTFYHFLLWRREFCFEVMGNFELKKMTPNCNALAKLIISYLWVSYYRRDTRFDAHLFCLYHVMQCTRSYDVTAWFFVCKKHCFTLSRKNKCIVRDSKVRNNQFCQCIPVWSHFLKFKITHCIEANSLLHKRKW